MASMYFAEGTFCTGDCGHTDCAWPRLVTISLCAICGEPIGHRHFYGPVAEDTGYQHAACYEMALAVSIGRAELAAESAAEIE